MGSVTHWLGRLKAGDPAAAQQLWEGYFRRLVRLARARLQTIPRRAADEEDVALSAFNSFCQGAEQGRFPRLDDRDDLWQVLVLLTTRKAANLVRLERRQRRGGGKVRNASALAGGEAGPGEWPLDGLVAREPDPEFAALVAEQCRALLERLANPALQAVAVWKMEGHTNEEIAAKLGRSVATVERKLQMIRQIWAEEGGP
jgi:DNA-directed RNA polymerase specialized sigma24 family protein